MQINLKQSKQYSKRALSKAHRFSFVSRSSNRGLPGTSNMAYNFLTLYSEENFPEYRNLKSGAIRKACPYSLDTGLDTSVWCQPLVVVLCRNKQYFSDWIQYIVNVHYCTNSTLPVVVIFNIYHLKCFNCLKHFTNASGM